MITHGELAELMYTKEIRKMEISEELFYSLPNEYREALLMCGNDKVSNKKRLIELRKKIALRQYNFEEKAKEKVLSILKKNK